jgi:hypothetical protein
MSDTDLAVRPENHGAMIRTSRGMTDTSAIIGWGVDSDPQNDPTYSYRDRSNDDHDGEWVRPVQQRPDVELLKSVEHKRLPAVFGTSSPPKWVSGTVRRLAFRWSESNWLHWLLLMGADRINMVEGVVDDIAHARLPNIPKEMGVRAEWRHNKTGMIKKIAAAALIGGALYAWSRSRQSGAQPERRTGQSPGRA